MGVIRLEHLAGAQDLVEHLHSLNEEGTTPVMVGWDATPQPFLITLVGPYAEGEEVLFDSPWQTDYDHGDKPPRCEDCRGYSFAIEDLRFPVTVIIQ